MIKRNQTPKNFIAKREFDPKITHVLPASELGLHTRIIGFNCVQNPTSVYWVWLFTCTVVYYAPRLVRLKSVQAKY